MGLFLIPQTMGKKIRAMLLTSFKDDQQVLMPTQVWSSHALSPEGVVGVSVSVQKESYSVKEWVEEFADVLNGLRKQVTEKSVIGGVMLSSNDKDFVIVSFYEEYDSTILTISETILQKKFVAL